MSERKIFLASKRAPITYSWSEETKRLVADVAPGGTANVVADMASLLGVEWIASAMTEEDRQAARENPQGMKISFTSKQPITVHLLQHDEAVFNSMQEVITADILWASNNYLWDSWSNPVFDGKIKSAWSDFLTFTDDFANTVLERSLQEKDPIYLIHDYQLVCVPELIRKERPDASILHFIHIPWPAADYWRMLPKYMRRPILQGMLGSSVVAFFAKRWARNFLNCVADLIPEAQVDFKNSTVAYEGRQVKVLAMPLGYSPQALESRKPVIKEDIKAWLGERKLILHSGRTDPIKNADRAVDAFLMAAEKNPAFREYRMLVRSNPNRLYIGANRNYLENLKSRINYANKVLGADVIRLVSENDVDATIGCIERADLLIFNSNVDGQNLTVYESSLLNKRQAMIILSERCGAAETLKDVCIMVNPFDVAELAAAIEGALMTSDKEKLLAYEKRYQVAKQYDLPSWVKMQLDSLK